MNVAILHYHFNRGGVTQVVLNQLQALDKVLSGGERLRVALIHGGRSNGVADGQLSGFHSLDVSMHTLSSLDYDDDFKVSDEQLANGIGAMLENAGFQPGTTLLHVHNHSLGKNVALPRAIWRLAQKGHHILLQIHDFAEDLRPDNYRKLAMSLGIKQGAAASALYPQARQIHYAALNRRDYNVFEDAGVRSANLHLLPNAAGDFGELPAKDLARRKLNERFNVPRDATYILYPVRGIRRKNVGEVLLWSALAAKNCFLGITLAPLNPLEQVVYQRWKQLATELKLPCVFETGGEIGLEFRENLAAADLMLTTSVAEGFGMVFLESWLASRNLVGRDLLEITSDFVQAGICLKTLYRALLIPIDWVGRDQLRESLTRALDQLWNSYGVKTGPLVSSADQQVSSLLQNESIDFAALDSSLQTRVIRMVHRDGALREHLLELNPRLDIAIAAEADETTIAKNADVVRKAYSLEASGERLMQIYQRVLDSRVDDEVRPLTHADRILSTFLDVTRLHPVRFEE